MSFLAWLVSGRHWVIIVILWLALCFGVAWIIRELRAEGGEAGDDQERPAAEHPGE